MIINLFSRSFSQSIADDTHNTNRSRQGFTLIELMVSAMILSVAVMSITYALMQANQLGELSRKRVAASQDASKVMEMMRYYADQSVASLKAEDWTSWAAANIVATKSEDELLLEEEAVAVTFTDLSEDTVQVEMNLTWSHRGHDYGIEIQSIMTDRGGA